MGRLLKANRSNASANAKVDPKQSSAPCILVEPQKPLLKPLHVTTEAPVTKREDADVLAHGLQMVDGSKVASQMKSRYLLLAKGNPLHLRTKRTDRGAEVSGTPQLAQDCYPTHWLTIVISAVTY